MLTQTTANTTNTAATELPTLLLSNLEQLTREYQQLEQRHRQLQDVLSEGRSRVHEAELAAEHQRLRAEQRYAVYEERVAGCRRTADEERERRLEAEAEVRALRQELAGLRSAAVVEERERENYARRDRERDLEFRETIRELKDELRATQNKLIDALAEKKGLEMRSSLTLVEQPKFSNSQLRTPAKGSNLFADSETDTLQQLRSELQRSNLHRQSLEENLESLKSEIRQLKGSNGIPYQGSQAARNEANQNRTALNWQSTQAIRARPIIELSDDRPIKPMPKNEVEKNFSKGKQEVIWGSGQSVSGNLRDSMVESQSFLAVAANNPNKGTLWNNRGILTSSNKDVRSEQTNPITDHTKSSPQTHREHSSTSTAQLQVSRPPSQQRGSNILTWDNPYDSRLGLIFRKHGPARVKIQAALDRTNLETTVQRA